MSVSEQFHRLHIRRSKYPSNYWSVVVIYVVKMYILLVTLAIVVSLNQLLISASKWFYLHYIFFQHVNLSSSFLAHLFLRLMLLVFVVELLGTSFCVDRVVRRVYTEPTSVLSSVASFRVLLNRVHIAEIAAGTHAAWR